MNHINRSIFDVVSHLLDSSADGDTYLPTLSKLASGAVQHKSKSDPEHISQEEVNELYRFLNLNEDLQPFLNNRPAKDIGINLSYIASRLVSELEKRDAKKIEQALNKLLPADGGDNDRRLVKIFIKGERDDDVDFGIVDPLDKNDLAPPNGNARRWGELVNNIGTNMAERRVFGDDYSVTLLASPKIARLSIPSNIITVRVDSNLEYGSSQPRSLLTTIGSVAALSIAVLVASANRSSSDVNGPGPRGSDEVIAKIDELSKKIERRASVEQNRPAGTTELAAAPTLLPSAIDSSKAHTKPKSTIATRPPFRMDWSLKAPGSNKSKTNIPSTFPSTLNDNGEKLTLEGLKTNKSLIKAESILEKAHDGSLEMKAIYGVLQGLTDLIHQYDSNNGATVSLHIAPPDLKLSTGGYFAFAVGINKNVIVRVFPNKLEEILQSEDAKGKAIEDLASLIQGLANPVHPKVPVIQVSRNPEPDRDKCRKIAELWLKDLMPVPEPMLTKNSK